MPRGVAAGLPRGEEGDPGPTDGGEGGDAGGPAAWRWAGRETERVPCGGRARAAACNVPTSDSPVFTRRWWWDRTTYPRPATVRASRNSRTSAPRSAIVDLGLRRAERCGERGDPPFHPEQALPVGPVAASGPGLAPGNDPPPVQRLGDQAEYRPGAGGDREAVCGQ